MPRRTAKPESSKKRGSSNEPRFLIVGRIRKPYGVRGELKVAVQADDPDRFFDLERVFVARDGKSNNPREMTVEAVRFHQHDALIKFAGIDDREVAKELNSQWLFVSIEDAVQLEEGEIYTYQIVGVDVVTDGGYALGTVSSILETGANDVFVVDGANGEILLPDIPDVVQSIDIENNKMIVTLMEGLLNE